MKKLHPTTHALTKYNITSPIDFDVAIGHGTVLMAISGADGELDEKELQWYIDEQKALWENAAEYIEELRGADWKNVDLEQALGSMHYDFPLNFRRGMIYQAIKMSRADGNYHERERASVSKAAELLKVDKFVLSSLESLADMEDGADKLRRSLLETTT